MGRASERDSHLIGLPIGPRHGSRGFDLPGWKRTETKTTAAPLAAGLAEQGAEQEEELVARITKPLCSCFRSPITGPVYRKTDQKLI
jgi:hypothetical protein